MADAIDVTKAVVDYFKDLLWDYFRDEALKKLFTAIPWLTWGPLKTVITWVVVHYSDELYLAAKTFLVMEAIPLRNRELARQYADSAYALKEAATIYGIDSLKFKELRNEKKVALAKFVRFHV